MDTTAAPWAPPFCPDPRCPHHLPHPDWRCKRAGHFSPRHSPRPIQRFQCRTCRRHFSEQTFRTTYWLRRPELLAPVFHGLVAGSGLRQLARSLAASPQTIALHAARLGRHCLLFHHHHRPIGPVTEPLALDGFQSFEFSQYSPTLFHLLVGQRSHFAHGFTVTELRRSGRMTARQKRRRAWLERSYGRPDPRAAVRDIAALLAITLPTPQDLVLHSDEHSDYPRALARLPHLRITHRTISSRAARTARNPLFALNLIDLLIRHSGANHHRETIAFSKRRQGAIERLWVFLVWRNFMKWFSERRRADTPAMRAGVASAPLALHELLAERHFVSHVTLPTPWHPHYWRLTPTRRIPNARAHHCRFAT